MTRCTIVPPYLLQALADGGEVQDAAVRTMRLDAEHRARRQGRPVTADGQGLRASDADQDLSVTGPTGPAARAGTLQRVVSDAQGEEVLPGTMVRGEGDPATGDAAVDEAHVGLGLTWTMFHEAFGRDSLDGRGLPLLATVHFGQDYDNAFWDGTQMVFGDGDGVVFQRFTKSLDVIGHELAHGVTETTAGLRYQGQSGALNESVSDVFGSLVRQHASGQTAEEADWLIGADLFTESVQGEALRSMKAPGTAYDDPRLGKDPQPGHMDDYVDTTDDNGGVHINSGIPNKAFHLAATTVGGHAWEACGQVWFDALTGEGIAADCDFVTFAALTVEAAVTRFGTGSAEAEAVAAAWRAVGVLREAEDSPPAGGGDASAEESGSGSPLTPGPADPPAGDGLEPDTEVRVRRTGGIAGQVRERTILVRDLPDEDVQRWRDLLARRGLEGLSGGPLGGRPLPDAFNYEVSIPRLEVAVTLPEHSIPEPVRGLIRRTLGEG